jgi:DNA-binding GntR family transcriptional regulator
MVQQRQIEGKFYPLQHEEWLRACRELTPAELKCLYYIRTSDPYSNGVRLTAAAIARDLSCEGQPPVSRQTVSRAIKRLDQLGYIEMEPLEFNVKISGKGILVCEDTDGVSAHHDRSSDTDGVSAHHDRSSDTTIDRQTPRSIATHHAESETHTQQGFYNSKTIKESNTNKDSSKTLLETRERDWEIFKANLSQQEFESFFNFAKEVAKSFKETLTTNAIRLPEAWIKKYYQELYNQFLDELEKQYGTKNFTELLEKYSGNSPVVEIEEEMC